jgi:hypothetical protein
MKHTKVILTGLVAMLALTGCQTTDNSSAADFAVEEESQTPIPESVTEISEETESTAEPETEPEIPEISYLSIGDSTMVGDWEITLLGSEITDSITGRSGQVNAEPGNKFLVNTFEIFNHGKQRMEFISNAYDSDKEIIMKILYGAGYEFSSFDIYESEDDLHMEELNPLTGKKGNLTYEIGSQVLDGEEDLVLRIALGGEEVYYKLRSSEPEPESQPLDTSGEESSTAAGEESAMTASEESELQADMQAETYLNVGDSAELDDWTITVTGAEMKKSVSDNYYRFDSQSGHQFMMVSVKVINNNEKSRSFLPFFLTYMDDINSEVIYGDGYRYSYIVLQNYKWGLESKLIEPSASQDGKIAYEVPEVVVNSEEPLLLRFYLGNQSVIYKIR